MGLNWKQLLVAAALLCFASITMMDPHPCHHKDTFSTAGDTHTTSDAVQRQTPKSEFTSRAWPNRNVNSKPECDVKERTVASPSLSAVPSFSFTAEWFAFWVTYLSATYILLSLVFAAEAPMDAIEKSGKRCHDQSVGCVHNCINIIYQYQAQGTYMSSDN